MKIFWKILLVVLLTATTAGTGFFGYHYVKEKIDENTKPVDYAALVDTVCDDLGVVQAKNASVEELSGTRATENSLQYSTFDGTEVDLVDGQGLVIKKALEGHLRYSKFMLDKEYKASKKYKYFSDENTYDVYDQYDYYMYEIISYSTSGPNFTFEHWDVNVDGRNFSHSITTITQTANGWKLNEKFCSRTYKTAVDFAELRTLSVYELNLQAKGGKVVKATRNALEMSWNKEGEEILQPGSVSDCNHVNAVNKFDCDVSQHRMLDASVKYDRGSSSGVASEPKRTAENMSEADELKTVNSLLSQFKAFPTFKDTHLKNWDYEGDFKSDYDVWKANFN